MKRSKPNFWTSLSLIILTLAAFPLSDANSAVLASDDFNTGSINSALWTTVGNVAIVNNAAQITGNGTFYANQLKTKSLFDRAGATLSIRAKVTYSSAGGIEAGFAYTTSPVLTTNDRLASIYNGVYTLFNFGPASVQAATGPTNATPAQVEWVLKSGGGMDEYIGSWTTPVVSLTAAQDPASYTNNNLTIGALGSGQTVTFDNVVIENSLPTPPTITSFVPGSAQVQIFWSVDPADPATAIGRLAQATNYLIEYKASTASGWNTFAHAISPATNATITGLANETSYDFRVSMVNSSATSAPSAVTSVVPSSTATAPYQVGGLTATAGLGQVGLAWSAPYNGGSAITDYLVEFKATASSTWSTVAHPASTDTSATVTGLTNSTTYDFRVSAINAIGTSVASTVVSATPATVPGAPTNVLGSAGTGQVTVSFTAPSSNGGSAITGYTVTSNPGNITASGPSSPITVGGLTGGTAYTFTVTATNIMGTGPASTASSVVTPAAFTNRALDNLSVSPAAAYSLRLLRKNYTGFAVQVRRSSDGVTQNIGFTNAGDLATSALLAFAGSSSCTVSIWYDQSGNGKNVANASAANQPLIVNAGSLVLQGSRVSVRFSQSPVLTTLSASSNLLTGAQSTISVVNQLTSMPGFNLFVGAATTDYFGWVGSSSLILTAANGQQVAAANASTTPNVVTGIRNATNATTYLSGTPVSNASNSLNSNAIALNSLGGFASYGLSGSMSEIVFFGSALSIPDKNALQADQGTAYGIAIADATPTPPTKLMAVPGNGSILLQWSGASGATDYKIEYKPTASSTWAVFPDGVSASHGYTITGLTNGTSYDFRITTTTPDGISGASSVLSATPAAGPGLTAWNQILSTGQSLSTGYNGGPPLTTTQPFANLMLTGDNASVIPLVEPATGASGSTESMSSALANSLTNFVGSSIPNYLSIVSMHGVPGVDYNTLKKGTGAYANGQAELNGAFDLAAAAGKTFSVRAVTTIHGESDESENVSAATYAGSLVQWQSDYQNDVQTVTGQTGIVPFFTDQMASWGRYGHTTPTTAIGQWTAARDNPAKIFLVTPIYIMDYSDGVHLTNYSYRRLGEYFAKVVKKVTVDKQSWLPLSPRTVTMTGNVITAKFNVPVAPLALDTTAVDLQPNYGFEYTDSTNSATIPGTGSISIVAPDTVQIVLSNAPTGASPILSYAYTASTSAWAGAHVSGSPKGNLRDSDATEAYYQDSSVPAATGKYLRNWSITFNEPITVVAAPTLTAPGSPTGLSAISSANQTSLSWTAPSDNGGSPITNYLVEYKASAVSTWSTFAHPVSTATSATITGLTGSTSYDFRVSAVNAVGTSQPSTPVSSTTRPDPNTITPVTLLLNNGSSQISVTTSAIGRSYTLQRSYTLESGSWVNLGDSQPGGGALIFNDTPDPQQPKVFYRLLVQ